MHTTDRTPTPEAPEHGSRDPGRTPVALMIAVAGVTTIAWIVALVVLAGGLISGVF